MDTHTHSRHCDLLGLLLGVFTNKKTHVETTPSVRPTISDLTICRIFVEFSIAVLYENVLRKYEFHENRL